MNKHIYTRIYVNKYTYMRICSYSKIIITHLHTRRYTEKHTHTELIEHNPQTRSNFTPIQEQHQYN